MAMMVEQLGLAMMPRWLRTASGLISGTTSGTVASMRKADELSTTTAPCSTASGAKRLEVLPPAEKSATSTPRKLSSVNSRTVSGWPRKGSVLPAERAEAYRRSSFSGKRLSSRQRMSSTPTAPVAPTIATTGEEPAERPDCMTDSRTNEAPAAVPTGPLVDSRSPGLKRARDTHQSPRPGLLHGDLVRFHHSGHTVSTLPEAKPAVKGRRGAYRNNRYSYRRS